VAGRGLLRGLLTDVPRRRSQCWPRRLGRSTANGLTTAAPRIASQLGLMATPTYMYPKGLGPFR
jgi:hypothetical protein